MAVAIIGVLVTIATVTISSKQYARTPFGYATQIAATVDNARMRAISIRRLQRLVITNGSVEHWEAPTEGMAPPPAWPVGWSRVQTVGPPSDVEIYILDNKPHLNPNDSVPAEGAGLGGFIDFAPDGSATAATVFVGDNTKERTARVAIFGATGTAYVFKGW